MPTIAPEHFKEVMRHWAAGVTIVTTRVDGEIHGCTANSFTSVSLTPPLVAVSLAKATHTYRLIKKSQIFAVNILGVSQRETSARFANSHCDTAERFQDEPHRTVVTGAPVLDRAIAFADCHVISEFDVGLNVIVIGMVEEGKVQNSETPLIYSDRQYWKLTQ